MQDLMNLYQRSHALVNRIVLSDGQNLPRWLLTGAWIEDPHETRFNSNTKGVFRTAGRK